MNESVNEVKAHIQKKLMELAKIHTIHILLAVESGSRAWGFASPNSDYDVRFIYARSKEDYLSIKEYRDVIETEIIRDDFLGVPLDLNGWDIRKALQLGLKSNPVLLEWLQSPIRYIADETWVRDITTFTYESADKEILKSHYHKIASNVFKQIKEDTSVKLKLYCYALRAALAFQWVQKYGDIPPIAINSLMDQLIINPTLRSEIEKLIALKTTALESSIIAPNTILDSFIESILIEVPAEHRLSISKEMYLKADTLFRKIISDHDNK